MNGRRKTPKKVSKRSIEHAQAALRGSTRSLKRSLEAYDAGDFHASRDLGAISNRILEELGVLRIRKTLKYADCRPSGFADETIIRVGDRQTIGKRSSVYSPYTYFGSEDGKVAHFEEWGTKAARDPDEADLDHGFGSRLSESKKLLEWVSFEGWRQGVVFAEPPHWFHERKKVDGNTKYRKYTREFFLTCFRNEVGSHYDQLMSECFHEVETSKDGFAYKVDGKSIPIANSPTDAIIRGLGGELDLTLEKHTELFNYSVIGPPP